MVRWIFRSRIRVGGAAGISWLAYEALVLSGVAHWVGETMSSIQVGVHTGLEAARDASSLGFQIWEAIADLHDFFDSLGLNSCRAWVALLHY